MLLDTHHRPPSSRSNAFSGSINMQSRAVCYFCSWRTTKMTSVVQKQNQTATLLGSHHSWNMSFLLPALPIFQKQLSASPLWCRMGQPHCHILSCGVLYRSGSWTLVGGRQYGNSGSWFLGYSKLDIEQPCIVPNALCKLHNPYNTQFSQKTSSFVWSLWQVPLSLFPTYSDGILCLVLM